MSHPKPTCPPEFVHVSESLHYIVTHIFFPVQLPDESDYTLENDLSLARAVCAAAHAYTAQMSGTSEPQWNRITRMLDNLQASVRSEHLDRDCVISQLCRMRTEDILPFLIRPHNSAIILTKRESCTLFESFEVVPSSDAARETAESAVYSYLGRALEIPNELLASGDFQLKLADALSHPYTTDANHLHPPLAHTQFITALFSGILRGVGRTIDGPCIIKRIRGDVLRSHDQPAKSLWRRSSLWLLIRVTIQSLDRSPLGRTSYKEFMLFFICTIATDPNLPVLSTDLLHSIASKILGRLNKLRSSIPDWLSQIALKACAGLREMFDARWMQLGTRSSPFRNPSQDELRRDTQLSLEDSHEYIRNALVDHHEPVHTPFHPNHRRRGNIYDFLSSDGAFFDEAYGADPEVTLYDVEQSVEQGIDEWIALVTNVDDACARLEILMDKYMQNSRRSEPEDRSIVLLTAIELFVALDKLVVEEIPIFADYSPEIPIVLLERLLLRRTTSLHLLSLVYQYLSARHSRSRPGWSILSSQFTEDSFAVRYYDQSPHHQQLKARIDEDAMVAGMTQSPLPSLPLHAKVVTFELQCPACIRIWRSAVARILHYHYDFDDVFGRSADEGRLEENLLSHVLPSQQRYFVDRIGPPLVVQIYFAYCYSREWQFQNDPTSFCYVVRYPDPYDDTEDRVSIWQLQHYEHWQSRFHPSRELHAALLDKYTNGVSHTANDVLAAQADCPADLSLDEFISFGQLRSGGSLQWINILQGLRSRTLNLRRHHVHSLFAYAVFQVGPLDVNTGTWIWHQDLQEPAFCSALLDELEDLFVEAGVVSIDGIMMSTISVLLTRVLASSPSKDVSERGIALLRRVRRKTFSWVQELSYNLARAPMNTERRDLLLYMAATCQSTFDVDSTTFSKLFHSAEDVDAFISGTLFIHAIPSGFMTGRCSRVLRSRTRRLTFALESILRNVILTDMSDYGIDLAVRKIFPCHKAGPNRWEQLQHPNVRWLTCQTKVTAHRPSQTVHLNLLDGTLRVDGHTVGGLPRAIGDDYTYRHIFHDQGFLAVPSNLPGMDFTTITMSKHKLHFSLRGDCLVVRAQCNHSKDILQLIPSSKLEKDLPPALINGYVHWLNLSTSIMEIRPLEHVWEESSENWRINCASGQYCAYNGHETLVDIRSPTTEMISKCFKCLTTVGAWYKDRLNSLLITVYPTDSLQPMPMLRLSVALPGYKLSFFVNEQGELESCDFKDMVYDENQCAGTLAGLENTLILRQKHHLPEGLIPKCVLIPAGSIGKHADHQFHVAAEHGRHTSSVEPLYHTYNMDTELGCLIGNGSLKSTGYLAHIHATTSCDWPDPLTCKTGAQAAICLFQSGVCRSIMKPKALDISDMWTSSRYPEIKSVLLELQLRQYWGPDKISRESASEELKRRATQSLAYQSWLPIGAVSPLEDYDLEESAGLTVRLPGEPRSHTPPEVTVDHLLLDRPAPELPHRSALLRNSHRHKTSSDDILELNQLFSSLSMDKQNSSFQQEYMALLEQSAQCIREHSPTRLTGKYHIDTLRTHYMQCRVSYFGALATLKQRLGPTTDPYEQALHQFGQWPPVTADILLRYLTSTSPFQLPTWWKKCLISLALLLLDLQRARRLLLFALDGLEEELSKELENEGCDGWDPEEFPDWLLIQIQGNFLIRRAQAETAMAMMSPQSGTNTVMQVNMGEGKSSVIIPIVAAALANGNQLVRVIVPKALVTQMFELLVARLGGFVNRPIYHLPFSRSSQQKYGEMVNLQVDDLHALMSQCMAERGILLVQPEHVVSLKLMSVEEQIQKGVPLADPPPRLQASVYKFITTALSRKQLSEDSLMGIIFRSLSRPPDNQATRAGYYPDMPGRGGYDSASKWLSLQKWIHSHVRDILDENDEILRPRFQLIYTVGHQHHMDGYPDRWTITQQVLRLVKECADTLSRNHINSVEYKRGPPGSFPHIRIVRAADVGQRLIPLILENVMAGRLPSVDFQDISDPALQRAIRSFISDKDALQVPETVKMVEDYVKPRSSDQSCMWSRLLLLRGLLTSNVLLFALTERRWRVDYGLVSQSRAHYHNDASTGETMLAVPYRAKDTPAPNTQFGHPDVTIILTCLSYYYGGLSHKQLRVSFEILLDEDDPTIEYALWVKYYDGSLPNSLRTLREINLKSSEQWDEVIFPLFSRNQATIDFYLARVVFPEEAKEYPWKLSASSWDLAERREKFITGFSGTNDNRWLLPMSIAQHNLDQQQGTNARVLSYLLRPENDFYMVIKQDGTQKTTHEFLSIVAMQTPEIRILLDVGAQVLDPSNLQVAKAWLNIACDAAGAVYFNENDELMVLMGNGITVPLLSSPLSQQLGRCIVYLDHAHTRGTDIKLPAGSRAAVTLGPKLTKDYLVQGCMRMRKLGHGHSVMFFAPPEVDWSIRVVAAKKDPNVRVATVDVLCWAIHETWTDIEQQAPYWAQQGMNHKSRSEAWSRYCNDDLTPEQLSDAWLQPEHRSLEDLYMPGEPESSSSTLPALDPNIRQRCKDLGILSFPSTQMEEEQEREVSREREREREVELPPKADPEQHFLHPDVVAFVNTGFIPKSHSGGTFRPIFTTLENSSAASVEGDVWTPFILATTDFCSTIKPESTKGTIDQYMRPVQWVLSSNRDPDQVLVLISPFEADRLMPDIRASKYIHLHVYAPRTSKRMKPSDDLKLYSIPPLPSIWTPPWILIDQLGVFAGQLYLRDYKSYLRLCHFLGVPTRELLNDGGIRRNLFNIPGSFESDEIVFSGSPLPSVMALLAIRTRGRPFVHTYMGKILQGTLLTEKDFKEPRSVVSSHATTTCDEETQSYFPSEITPLSPSDMECDPESPLVLCPSPKRRLERADISDTSSEPSQKRRRFDS